MSLDPAMAALAARTAAAWRSEQDQDAQPPNPECRCREHYLACSIHRPQRRGQDGRQLVTATTAHTLHAPESRSERARACPPVAGCPDLDPTWPGPDGNPRGPVRCTSFPACRCGEDEERPLVDHDDGARFEVTSDHSLLDLIIAGRVLEACLGFRDTGASAALWETVAPDLLGQPIADIAEYASAQRAAGGADADGADADAWGGVASALARSSRTTGSPRDGTARGLHDVVEVIGDVTAVVATARAVAMPIAALVRRALERRRQRAQSGDVQIEVDLPPAASPVGLADRVSR